MLTLIKAVHTLIFIIMATAVFIVVYCGATGQLGLPLLVSLVLLAAEGLVFFGNGMVCPLTTLARRYGAKKGYVFDSFFPEKWTRYTFPVFGSILAIGLAMVVARLLGR